MLRGSGRAPRQLLNRAISLATALFLAAAPVVAQPAQTAHAVSSKISPALFAQMTANPLQRVPIILELNQPSLPFSAPVNSTIAQQAIAMLNANGQAIGGLPIINGAAGYAN